MLVQKAVLLSLNEAAEVLLLSTKTILWSVTSKENNSPYWSHSIKLSKHNYCVLTLRLNRIQVSEYKSLIVIS